MTKKWTPKERPAKLAYIAALDEAVNACINNDAMRDEDWDREPCTDLLAAIFKVNRRTVAKDLCNTLAARMADFEADITEE